MKIAFISKHPAPYRDDFLRRLVKTPELKVDVFTEKADDAGHRYWALRDGGYNTMVLAPDGRARLMVMMDMVRRFAFGRYDLVIWPGFMEAYCVVPMFLMGILGKKYGFSADTMKQRPITGLKKWLKTFLVRHASLAFVPGKAGEKFFTQEYGVNLRRICKGAYALDNYTLAPDIAARRLRRHELRQGLGLKDDDVVFLMVANMLVTRHYPITVEGFSAFAKQHLGCKFIAVGNGPDHEKMVEYAKMHPEIIVRHGCSFEEMKDYYALADVYVHGGTEPASSALVIGAIAGLPVVSSEAVGCSQDVLMDGESGVLVEDYLSASAWTAAFEKLYSMKDGFSGLGKKASELSEDISLYASFKSFVEKLNAV